MGIAHIIKTASLSGCAARRDASPVSDQAAATLVQYWLGKSSDKETLENIGQIT